MYSFETDSKRKQKPAVGNNQPEFLVHASEPLQNDSIATRMPTFRYHSRYLAKRRVMRTIRRLRHK